MSTKKAIITIIVILVVVGLVVWFWPKSKGPFIKTNPNTPNSVENKPIKVDKKEVPVTQTPSGLPTDLPSESGAKIIQNYNATAEDGTLQATRVYQTEKTLDENYKIYQNYITNNGWKLVNSLNQDKLKVLAASKDKASLQISLSQNPTTKANMVSISYTIKK